MKLVVFSNIVIKEIVKYSPVKILSVFIALLSFKLLTSTFSLYEFGIYNLIISSFNLISVILTGWIGFVLMRYFERHKIENSLVPFLSTIFTILFSIIALFYIIFFLVLLLHIIEIPKIIVFPLLVLPLTVITSLLPIYYQLHQNLFNFNLSNIFTSLGVILLYYLTIDIWDSKIFGYFFSVLIINSLLILHWLFDLYKNSIKLSIFRINLREYLFYGIPQVLTSICILIITLNSRYFIQFYDTTENVGLFSAASKFGELSITLPLSIFTSIFSPYIFRIYESKGKNEAIKVLWKYITLYFLILGPIFSLYFLFPEISKLLLGESFNSAISLIPFIIFSNFFFGLSQFVGFYSQFNLESYKITISICISLILNIFLNYSLIPRYSINGAIFSSLITYILYVVLIIVLSRKFFLLIQVKFIGLYILLLFILFVIYFIYNFKHENIFIKFSPLFIFYSIFLSFSKRHLLK